jgi:hypothetical protein
MKTRTNLGEEMDLNELEAVSGGLALSLIPAVALQRNQNTLPEPQGGLIGWRSAPEPDHTALYVNAAVQLFQGVMRGYAQGGGFQSQGYGYDDYPQATYGADDYDAYDSGYDYGGYDGYSDGGYGVTGI